MLLAALLLLTTGAVAQEQAPPEEEEELFVPLYTLGDQTLAINLGGVAPLFFALGPDGVAPTNLSFGGAGSLAWGSYITNEFKLGIEAGGAFFFSPNSRALFLVPITTSATYVFGAYPWEFPVSAGLGVSFARLESLLKIDPFVRLGGSVYWNYSTQWAFGLNLNYWLVPQIYLPGSAAGSDATRLGNFLEITLSALYHF